MAVAFEYAKHDCLAVSASPSFAFDASAAEVRFIDLHDAGDRKFFSLALLCDAIAKTQIQRVSCSYRKTSQLCTNSCRKVESKTKYNGPKFGLCDFRTAVIPVFL